MTQNYIISYDLNGNVPTHAQMDKHLHAATEAYGRILETVWYARTDKTTKEVYDYVDRILSANDRLIVARSSDAWFRNLLVNQPSLQQAWSLAA